MIDLDLARDHLKADGDDDPLIVQYLAQAASTCEGYCNRKFYVDEAARTADRTQCHEDMVTAVAARDDALADPDNDSCEVQQMIRDRFTSDWAAILRRSNGVVVDSTIEAAILLTLGHFYANRQDNVVGQYSGASRLPVNAQRVLQPYLWIGNLAGGGS